MEETYIVPIQSGLSSIKYYEITTKAITGF